MTVQNGVCIFNNLMFYSCCSLLRMISVLGFCSKSKGQTNYLLGFLFDIIQEISHFFFEA